MSMEIQQTASLIITTNKILNGIDIDYLSYHSTIQFVKYIHPPIGAPDDLVYNDRELFAQGPTKWLSYLKERGVSQIRMHYLSSIDWIPKSLQKVFKGGIGEWIIEAIHDSKSEIYEIGKRLFGSKFFGFHLLMIREDLDILPDTTLKLEIAYDSLCQTLEKLISFTEQFDFTENWLKIFKRAKRILTGKEHVSFDGLFPQDILDEKVRNLLVSAFSSHVFGGMGSWNDLAFQDPDHAKYETLTKSLHNAINEAIESAVNSTGKQT